MTIIQYIGVALVLLAGLVTAVDLAGWLYLRAQGRLASS